VALKAKPLAPRLPTALLFFGRAWVIRPTRNPSRASRILRRALRRSSRGVPHLMKYVECTEGHCGYPNCSTECPLLGAKKLRSDVGKYRL
jgi:hypothetical protein